MEFGPTYRPNWGVHRQRLHDDSFAPRAASNTGPQTPIEVAVFPAKSQVADRFAVRAR